jgi:hypothetical protein
MPRRRYPQPFQHIAKKAVEMLKKEKDANCGRGVFEPLDRPGQVS